MNDDNTQSSTQDQTVPVVDMPQEPLMPKSPAMSTPPAPVMSKPKPISTVQAAPVMGAGVGSSPVTDEPAVGMQTTSTADVAPVEPVATEEPAASSDTTGSDSNM